MPSEICQASPKVQRESRAQGGDDAKDDVGYRVEFTEQGASSSQNAATFLDIFSRLPVKAGEPNDAVSPYTEVRRSEASRLVGGLETEMLTRMEKTATQLKTKTLRYSGTASGSSRKTPKWRHTDRIAMGKTFGRSAFGNTVGKQSHIWEWLCFHRTYESDHSFRVESS